MRIERHGWLAFPLAILIVALAGLPVAAQSGPKLLGGPSGIVKTAGGDPLEGMMVQLIAKKTAIRTTVYSDADGRYEFPKLDAGTYTLRIALPREFQPYAKEGVEINGAEPARRHHALTRTRSRAAAALAGDRRADDGLGMAA